MVPESCGIEHVSRSASYIGTWLKRCRTTGGFIFTMAKAACEAAEYILPQARVHRTRAADFVMNFPAALLSAAGYCCESRS
jgi:antirestriction protein ArdC